MKEYKVPVQSLIDHIKTATDVDPWAKEMAEELLKEQETMMQCIKGKCRICPHCANCDVDENGLLKEHGAVKPYIDIDEAKCPICKVKLTRQELLGDDVLFEDFFDYCPHCGKAVKWDA